MAIIGDQIIISGDAHFAEPPDLFQTRLPLRLRERAPHAVRTPEGEFWISGHLRNPVGGSVGGYQAADFKTAIKAGYEGAPKSVWDPAARLKEQDRDTIAAEVLYSSWGLFLFGMDDDDLRAECFTAFNDWAGEYCSDYPNRLKGVGLCDVTDPATAVRHLEQIKRLGLNGALIASSPVDERPYFLDDYDPVWSAAAELGLPLTMHILTGAKGKGMLKYSATLPDGRPSPETRVHYVTRVVVDLQASLAYMIASGVFDRHPNLRIVLAETDVGWWPHFIYRMDHFNGEQGMQEWPTRDYFKNNIYATVQFESDTLRLAKEEVGADRFMWASDYPHMDCAYPEDRDLVRTILASGFSDEDAAFIARDTAAALYGIDVSALKVPSGA
jgi:predicted TIM-barrel fold metal-dependent hydrolase